LDIVDNLSPIDSKTGLSVRCGDKLDALREALTISLDKGCDLFMMGGDMYNKLNPPEKLKRAFYDVLVDFMGKISIMLFPGNHDGAGFTNNYLSDHKIFGYFGQSKPIDIIMQRQTIYLGKGKDLYIMPWTTDLESLQSDIHALEDRDLLGYGHLEISGSLASSEYVLTPGVKSSLFKHFKRVSLGHYHRRQPFYVGSPISKDFGETGIEKGFEIYDTETSQVEFYQLDHRLMSVVTVTEESWDSIADWLDNTPPPPGSLIKLIVNGTPDFVNNYYQDLVNVFNSLDPLKLVKKKEFVDPETSTPILKVQAHANRVDKIKELADGEDEASLDYGLSIFKQAEDEYLEVKV
jgi:DNA repair exonuclease SbcCD nuclease subunit